MVNKQRLIGLTKKLLSLDSQNPPGDEKNIGLFVAGYMKRLGLKVDIYEFKKGRINVIARLKSPGQRHSLIITPHLDTVPAGKSWESAPLKAKISSGRIYGLGATDCKGNLASAMEAVRSIVEEKRRLGFDLIFAATADEECGSGLGLIPLLDKGYLKASAALVLDADDFHIVVAQKGLIHLKVKVQGRRAHGAYPWLGENAIDASLKIISQVKSRMLGLKKNKYLRMPTVNTGTIRGGDKVNIVSDWCEFELDFRFLPGTKAEDIIASLKQAVRKHARRAKIEIQSIQQPYAIPESHPLVTGLKKAMQSFRLNPKVTGSEGATVITFFQHKGIPALATGFGKSGCAHIDNEYAKIDHLYKGALALEKFLTEFQFKESLWKR